MNINSKICACLITDSNYFFPCNVHFKLLPFEIQEGFNLNARKVQGENREI